MVAVVEHTLDGKFKRQINKVEKDASNFHQSKYHKIMCKYLMQKQVFTGIIYLEFYTRSQNFRPLVNS